MASLRDEFLCARSDAWTGVDVLLVKPSDPSRTFNESRECPPNRNGSVGGTHFFFTSSRQHLFQKAVP